MTIRLFNFNQDMASPIRAYASHGAHSSTIAHGSGASYAYTVYVEPGGAIGPHPAGFDQLFIVVKGSGWVRGSDGVQHALGECCGAFIPTGENHSKGSEEGMVALMVQASQFTLAPAALSLPDDFQH